MRIAVISITEKGRVLSQRIADSLHKHSVLRYCFEKYCDLSAAAFNRVGDVVQSVFNSVDAIVFVSACGIAVRAIAPHIKSKTSDPAVVVVDDGGIYAISLLSGHLGGANRLTETVAESIGAKPVITTSTDVGGLFSPDSFAAANNLIIGDMNKAKQIAAAVTNGEKIGLYSEFELSDTPDVFCENAEKGVCISADREKKPFFITLNLIPRNIVLGIGCKKGTDCDTIADFVNSKLAENEIDIHRVCAVASIDLKKEEHGLIGFCKSIGAEFYTFSADELNGIAGDFTTSEFVSKVTGVDNVCERSAAAYGGRIVLKKCSGNGVTLAVAELSVNLDFNKEMF